MAIAHGKLLREVRQAFGDAVTTITALHSAAQVRPSDPNAAIQISRLEPDSVELTCSPTVCYVPEKAALQTASLYVVFTGFVVVSTASTSGVACTLSYATNFGYFSVRGGALVHPLGGHYDFHSGDVCHPRAHLQLRSQIDMLDYAREFFPSVAKISVVDDKMFHILDRVRAPSAQMDFLSYMVQIAADHLVDKGSARATRTRFSRLAGRCEPFMGYEVPAGHASGECHRGGHWYPVE